MEAKSNDVAAKGSAESVVIEMGKKSRKKVKKLRRGRGPLLEEVNDTITELQAEGKLETGVAPVIVVVRGKQKSSLRSLTRKFL